MSPHQWSDRNGSLEALGLAIQHGSHGLIRDLSVDLADDDAVVVRGVSRSYYGVQLAIHATQQFAVTHPLLPETRLRIRVETAMLELVVLQPEHDAAQESPSAHDAERRSQLTVAASA